MADNAAKRCAERGCDDFGPADLRFACVDCITAEASVAEATQDVHKRRVLRLERDFLLEKVFNLNQRAERAERLLASLPSVIDALRGAVEWMEEDGCDCGDANDLPCRLCVAQHVLSGLVSK